MPLRKSAVLQFCPKSHQFHGKITESILWIRLVRGSSSIAFRLTATGHADFGGEVERVISMVDGVVLVVDATEVCELAFLP